MGRDQVVGQLTSVAPPHAGIFQLEWDEHFARVNRIDSPIRDIASLVEFSSPCSHNCRDSGVILVESWENGAPAEEGLFWGPPTGVLPVCAWSPLSLTWFFLLLSSFLNSKCEFWMTGVVPQLHRLFVGRLHAWRLPCTWF
jgi:hypothetical protein